MKAIHYIILITILIISSGYLLIGKSNQGNANIQGNGGKGDFQKITLSFKDYNYYPNTVQVSSGKPVRISLDDSVVGCFRDFTIRQFGIHEYLATPSDYVEFTPTKPGTYTFACSMGMGTGTLIVK